MAFVILERCSSTEKAAECVSVYPVDCIEEEPKQFYIDPEILVFYRSFSEELLYF